MAFKFIAFATLVAAASAGLVPATPVAYHAAHAAPVAYTHGAPLAYAAPVVKTVLTKTIDAEYDSNPQYSYSYDVHDSLTGDVKSQHETRNGDAVEGSYSLVEADGSRRVVHYTADAHNGFNAVVEKEPAQVAVKAVAVKAVAPVAYAHPVAYQHASPVVKVAAPVAHATYAAPVAHATYAAPVAHATYAAPVAHATYAAPVAHATYAAPAYAAHGYAAPVLAHSYYH